MKSKKWCQYFDHTNIVQIFSRMHTEKRKISLS